MTYYMTAKINVELGIWERCKATTLIGAKREAARRYGPGWIGAHIMIATGDNVTEQRRVLASKRNHLGSRWHLLEV